MELLQLIRLPLDPLHLLCQPLAELDPGWGRAGAQDTRLEVAAPIGAVAAREEGLVGALGRGECGAAARPRLAPAVPNQLGVDATCTRGPMKGVGRGAGWGEQTHLAVVRFLPQLDKPLCARRSRSARRAAAGGPRAAGRPYRGQIARHPELNRRRGARGALHRSAHAGSRRVATAPRRAAPLRRPNHPPPNTSTAASGIFTVPTAPEAPVVC